MLVSVCILMPLHCGRVLPQFRGVWHLAAGWWSRIHVIGQHRIFYGLLSALSGNCSCYNWVNMVVQDRPHSTGWQCVTVIWVCDVRMKLRSVLHANNMINWQTLYVLLSSLWNSIVHSASQKPKEWEGSHLEQNQRSSVDLIHEKVYLLWTA